MSHSMPEKHFPQRRAASLIVARNHKRGAGGKRHDDFNHRNIKAER